mmetsp:Transcript_81830/g.128882  ORF Transcript_81830/g.128882 Transcript_81830/m.128882 type:complete len:108 (-) Transcript_81830:94-417(-)|eukprot:CAMPEP_0169268724 /NCGR_PEP_ID=MMETSP1016-20121227/47992_1 /TAXON_ID=342587 /ORGANISM="Karlodinium micrum, Strain CCMP2283" /LENGTH=107 /DNA_ID=CAMNT_0009353533 /DNA_START=90 /DNA_END=413 /DNA_ORIENTATION=+
MPRSHLLDRVEEMHRSLRPRKGNELSMKQAGYFLGGLYLVIWLLQWWDIRTLLVVATGGYLLYRHFMTQMESFSGKENGDEAVASQDGARKMSTKGKKAAGSSKKKS